jgi:hypothetical protein
MTDFERALYRTYVRSLTDRGLFVEREAVYAQAELANPGMLMVLAQEFETRRNESALFSKPARLSNEPTVYQNVPKERPLRL